MSGTCPYYRKMELKNCEITGHIGPADIVTRHNCYCLIMRNCGMKSVQEAVRTADADQCPGLQDCRHLTGTEKGTYTQPNHRG